MGTFVAVLRNYTGIELIASSVMHQNISISHRLPVSSVRIGKSTTSFQSSASIAQPIIPSLTVLNARLVWLLLISISAVAAVRLVPWGRPTIRLIWHASVRITISGTARSVCLASCLTTSISTGNSVSLVRLERYTTFKSSSVLPVLKIILILTGRSVFLVRATSTSTVSRTVVFLVPVIKSTIRRQRFVAVARRRHFGMEISVLVATCPNISIWIACSVGIAHRDSISMLWQGFVSQNDQKVL